MSSIDGMRKAKVLPLPVLAAARTSLQRSGAFTKSQYDSGLKLIILLFSDHLKMCFYLEGQNSPSLQQGTNTFVLDLSHVFKAHLLHCLQRALTHQPGKRGKGCVLKCSWNISAQLMRSGTLSQKQIPFEERATVKHEKNACKEKELIFQEKVR